MRNGTEDSGIPGDPSGKETIVDISFSLEAFEGPLDLLIHLIEKNKVNIYDIPIAMITDQYMEYNASENYKELGFEKHGSDFFNEARKEAVRTVYPNDLELFLSGFTKEKVMEEILL